MAKFLFGSLLLFIICLFGCSKNDEYNEEEALRRGDIVYQNKVKNIKRLNEFIANFSNNKPDTIRITVFTKEGDPIFQDLKFDEEAIQYNYDNSNDQYAGKGKGIKFDVCKSIAKKENDQNIFEYYLSNCTKNHEYFLIPVE